MKVGGPKRVMPYFLLNVLNCYYHCVFFSCIFIFIDLFLLFVIHMQFFFSGTRYWSRALWVNS